MNFFRKHYILLLLILITLLGLSLRLTLISKGDFWLDEAFTGIFVRENWESMYRMIIIDFVHPPFYYTLLKLWTDIFNNTSVETIRLFSILFGTLLIPIAYHFMNTLLKGEQKYISLLSSLILSINPFFISYSIEARSYALLAVLGLLTANFFLEILREDKLILNRRYFIFVILTILLVLTHYITVIYLLCLGISYVILKPKTWKTIRNILKLFIPSLLALITIMTVFILVRGNIIGTYDFTTGNVGWIPKATLSNIPLTVYNFLFGVQAQSLGVLIPNSFKIELISPYILGVFIFSILVISICMLIRNKAHRSNLTYLLSLSILPIFFVILLSWGGLQMYMERYMIIFGTGIILLSVYLLSKGKILLVLGVTFIYIFLLLNLKPTPFISTYSDLCREINGKNVLVDDPGVYILISYYCDESKVRLYTNNRNFYKEWWLVIGYNNTVDRVIERKSDIFIKTNNEITSNSIWEILQTKQIGAYGELAIYSIN